MYNDLATIYVRLKPSELALLYAAPGDSELPGAAIDLEHYSAILAWLLSPLKRYEQALFAATHHRVPIPDLGPKPALDPLWKAIQGVSGHVDPRIETPFGHAIVLTAAEVKASAEALGAVDEAQLRAHFDPEQLEYVLLMGPASAEEAAVWFDEQVLPALEDLQDFYRTAAEAGECVAIWDN